jgi:hypothetical protein
MLKPSRLKENTPKTYEFIRRCIKEWYTWRNG